MAIDEDEKKIVIARLETMPPDLEVSIGDHGTFDKWELIENVNGETDIGRLVVEAYMDNIRSFKKEMI